MIILDEFLDFHEFTLDMISEISLIFPQFKMTIPKMTTWALKNENFLGIQPRNIQKYNHTRISQHMFV